jgi:hypothetical protein
MSVFRSYFSKNNTLIKNNRTNNGQNPVTEISYGTITNLVTRFIFDIDLEPIKARIQQGIINENRITKHILTMTNTIAAAPKYIGKKSYSESINRASSVQLELFNITQDWDGGAGYDFIYEDTFLPMFQQGASNWFSGKTNSAWIEDGCFVVSGTSASEILATQSFPVGNEDIQIDITDYINSRLFSGSTGFTGTTFGLGLKYPENIENLKTQFIEALAFFTKNTNTFYEPYVETFFDNTIRDDRNFFFLDKPNELYLYVNVGNSPENVIISGVTIYDYEDNIVGVVTGITNVTKGVYKIELSISSDLYPDAVIFKDVWTVIINGKQKEIEQEFYLISQDNYYTFDLSNQIDINNYFFYFYGIADQAYLKSGEIRKVKLVARELYPNQSNYIPLDLMYRVYTTTGSDYQIEVIPETKVSRTSKGYEFDLDTSWFIPQDYYLEIKLSNGSYYETKQSIKFTIVSNKVLNNV